MSIEELKDFSRKMKEDLRIKGRRQLIMYDYVTKNCMIFLPFFLLGMLSYFVRLI